MHFPEQEQRRFSRVNYKANVLLHANGEKYRGRLLDLSLNGALVNTKAELALHNKVQLDIIINDKAPVITMHSEVIHLDEQDIGFQCDEIDIDSMVQLRQLINSFEKDPEHQSKESKSLWELKVK